MADQDNPHFDRIYWYIVLTTLLVFGYCVAVSFIVIPTSNTRVVDTITGFLLGTILSAGVGYLLGGNPTAARKAPDDVDNMKVDADKVEVKQNTDNAT